MVTQINHFIDGRRVPGGTERRLLVFNPATGEQTGSVAAANASDVADAVAAACRAAQGWADTTPLRRARVLNRFLRILEDRAGQLAVVIVSEHGKVHSDGCVLAMKRHLLNFEAEIAIRMVLRRMLTRNIWRLRSYAIL